jgi:dTDP-4-amino-4,6-dideoxygalactose transaminase
MRKNWILLWDSWSWINIAPKWTCLKCSQYKFDCPSAEKISKNILFLPNSKFVNIKEAEKVVKLANNYNKDELWTKRNWE